MPKARPYANYTLENQYLNFENREGNLPSFPVFDLKILTRAGTLY